jgi:hypothetical protein
MIVMWLQNTLKLATPSFAACKIVIAVEGAVVSKPRPRKTTCFAGLFFAIFIADGRQIYHATARTESMGSCQDGF